MAGDFSGFGSGLERGMALAQHAEQLTQSRQQLEEQKKMNLIKVGDAIMESYNSAATLKDPKARQMAFEEARHKSELLGKPVSDSVHAMLSGDTYRTEMLQATASMLGLPDAQKAEQYGSIGQILGGDPKLLASTFMSMRDMMNKEAQTKLAKQPDVFKPAQVLSELQGKAHSVLGSSIDAIQAAEGIRGMALMPEKNLSALTAQTLLGRLKDPGSAVRDAEQAGVERAVAQGSIERALQVLREKGGGGKLTNDQWQSLLDVANMLAKPHEAKVQRYRDSLSKQLQGTGISPDQVISFTIPPEDVTKSNQMVQQRLHPPTQTAQAKPSGYASLTPAEQAALAKYNPALAAKYTAGGKQ